MSERLKPVQERLRQQSTQLASVLAERLKREITNTLTASVGEIGQKMDNWVAEMMNELNSDLRGHDESNDRRDGQR